MSTFDNVPSADEVSPEVPVEDYQEQREPVDPDEAELRLRRELPDDADPADVVEQRVSPRDPVGHPELATPIGDRLEHAAEADVLDQERDARMEDDEPQE